MRRARFILTSISAAIQRQAVFKIKNKKILWNQINEKQMFIFILYYHLDQG